MIITIRAAREYITTYVAKNRNTMSVAEMAKDLQVSETTIRNHYRKLRHKYGWKNKKLIRRSKKLSTVDGS